MPKSANQKLRLLFEREILLRETDEENPITTKQLISRLEDCGVQAERKTIYMTSGASTTRTRVL